MMSTPDKNYTRWLTASIYKHFVDNCPDLTLHLEGQFKESGKELDSVEVRIDGPFITQTTKQSWRFYLEVNLLVTSRITTDLYVHQRHIGEATNAFDDISIYKYGSGDDDDDSLLGCLQLWQEPYRSRHGIQVQNFGQIDPVVKVQQASVEGHYRMFIKE